MTSTLSTSEELCAHCVSLLGVSAAGILLGNEKSLLHTVAASDENTHLLELFAVQHDQGPCRDCYQTGKARANIGLHDPVAIALLQQRDIGQEQLEKGQLQRALSSRIVVEPAKDILAERRNVTPDSAYNALRAYAHGLLPLLIDAAPFHKKQDCAVKVLFTPLKRIPALQSAADAKPSPPQRHP